MADPWTRLSPAAGGLPVFRKAFSGCVLFYTPGYLVAARPDQAQILQAGLAAGGESPEPRANAALAALRQRAAEARLKWEDLFSSPFRPLCLTLYMNYRCNLACAYCYASPQASHTSALSSSLIRAAAEVVAQNCRRENQPLTVVLHGGGEPTLSQGQAERALEIVEATAAAYDLPVFRYIATNGALSPEKAEWIASRFDLVGISCDGPAPIHAQQRPFPDGSDSLPWVERTAGVLRRAGRPFHVRVTLTPFSFQKQEEIAAYVCEQLKPQEIHVEPVYRGGRCRPGDGFERRQAEAFVEGYLKGRRAAKAYGVPWLTSGCRPGEVHGPYCHFLRQVLQLIPGDQAAACFKTSHRGDGSPDRLILRRGEQPPSSLSLDGNQVRDLRRELAKSLEECRDCFNYFHCTRGCPDGCFIDSSLFAVEGSFRCSAQKNLADALLEEAARDLIGGLNEGEGLGSTSLEQVIE